MKIEVRGVGQQGHMRVHARRPHCGKDAILKTLANMICHLEP